MGQPYMAIDMHGSQLNFNDVHAERISHQVPLVSDDEVPSSFVCRGRTNCKYLHTDTKCVKTQRMTAIQIHVAGDPINGHESHVAIYTTVVMVVKTNFLMNDRIMPSTKGVTLLLIPSYKTKHNTFYSRVTYLKS
jgi:hypothetical protein